MAILQNSPPKHDCYKSTEQATRKLKLSNDECDDLEERELKCPYCYYIMGGIFSDAGAHIRLKCPKCGAAMILNTAYFRRKSKTPWQGFRRIKNVR
ncbi:MAG: hypothetical protein EOM05_08925 [Clostridia bacterium]|nr:hypothetical protein [Clostridia bacterium]